MRNRIMHGYFDVDRDAVWDAVSVEVPELESQIRAIVAEET